MSKRVIMTPKIAEKIRLAIGDGEADVSNFVVFEARSLTTEPLNKRGFYNKAQVAVSTLNDMAKLLNQPGKAIPLQIMHETQLLPVGKIFSAEVFPMANGHTELRTQFYLPSDKEDIIRDIENSVIDEVSVGFLAEKVMCSECGFDYFGPEASFSNMYNLECNEGHVIGEAGVHVRLVGVNDWAELSLVNRGAARDAKILSRAKQAMSQDTVNRLAASAISLDARITTVNSPLEAAASNTLNNGDNKMDKEFLLSLEAKVTETVELKHTLAKVEGEKTQLAATVSDLTTQLTAANEQIRLLKENQTADQAKLAADLSEANTKMEQAVEKLSAHAKAALTASGAVEADLPTDLVELVSMIEEKGLKLHQVIGTEPKADAAKSVDLSANASAYEARRKEAFKITRKN